MDGTSWNSKVITIIPPLGHAVESLIWPSHKHLEPYNKDMVRRLRDNNIDLSKTRYFIYHFFGAMKKVLLNKWALKSLCESITTEHSQKISYARLLSCLMTSVR
jgi:hypothetical protein